MINILCYGDSNTHGFNLSDLGRFPYDVRWTGRLAKLLGEGYHVNEGGINGRTAAYDDPEVPCRNGLEAVDWFLCTHKPLDAFVLMLGTNDTKDAFCADADTIARQVEKLAMRVEAFPYESCPPPKIVIISPVPLDERAAGIYGMSLQSVAKSKVLGASLESIAKKHGWHFLDAALWDIDIDSDGCHLSAKGHARFAEKLTQFILETFPAR